jgi:hypothetical protein
LGGGKCFFSSAPSGLGVGPFFAGKHSIVRRKGAGFIRDDLEARFGAASVALVA